MPPEPNPQSERPTASAGDALTALIHEADQESLGKLLENLQLEEPHVCLLLERMDLSASILEKIAAHAEWVRSEGVKLRLARHPRTPRRLALSLVRQLYLFDLVRLSLLPSAPPEVRRLAEEVILTRIPHLPVGEKLTLARRGPARVAGALLAEGHPQALKLALNNSFLTESQVLKVLSKPSVPERVVAAIAPHPKWSCQYNVRLALARNAHTPYPVLQAFLPNLTLRDLHAISKMETLAPRLREQIRKELARRAAQDAEAGAGIE
jgi:hypothetical protein